MNDRIAFIFQSSVTQSGFLGTMVMVSREIMEFYIINFTIKNPHTHQKTKKIFNFIAITINLVNSKFA
jgi:hypothetical protein